MRAHSEQPDSRSHKHTGAPAASRRVSPRLPTSSTPGVFLPRPSRILQKLLPAMLQQPRVQPRVQLQRRSREFYACTPPRDTRAPTTCDRRLPELLRQVAPSVSTLRDSTLNRFHSVAAESVFSRCSRLKARP